MRSDSFRICMKLVQISLMFIRGLADPLLIGSPIRYQMITCLELYRFRVVPRQCKLKTIQLNLCQSGSDPS